MTAPAVQYKLLARYYDDFFTFHQEGFRLNHIPEKSDFALVAQSAARALRLGGTFCFDVNNRKALETRWEGMQRIAKSGVILILWGGYDRQRDRGWANAEWFIKTQNRWCRVQEHVEEVCWSSAEIRRGLRQANFHRIRAFDAAPFFRGVWDSPPGCRTFYLARKSAP